MWYDLYRFIDLLNETIENYPTKAEFKIKMDEDLYNFFINSNFISNDSFYFKGRTFIISK